MNDVDILVAGQGAAAYAAALYSARYRANTVVVGGSFGGETATGGLIENYPGAPEIDGFDLMLEFKKQVTALEVPIVESDLKDVTPSDGRFICELADGSKYRAISVVMAIGRERRVLGLEHEEEWTGKGISYCSTCDAPLYRNKQAAAVVGGGNAAVEGAILLAKYAQTVYLIYRRGEFTRPEPILIETLQRTPNVKQVLNTTVTELIGDDSFGLTDIRLSQPYEGQEVLKVDGLFVEAGADPRVEIPLKLGLEINSETGEVHVGRSQETNVEGIYAAGDLTDGTALKQTVTAAAQGAMAALSAYQHTIKYRATTPKVKPLLPLWYPERMRRAIRKHAKELNPTMTEEVLYEKECYDIQGAIFEVYTGMGPGFVEAVYQEPYEKALAKKGVPFHRPKLNLS